MGLFTVPGAGDLDFAPLAALIRDRGYAGWCVVEAERDPETPPPGDLARRAFAHVTGLLRAAGVVVDAPDAPPAPKETR